MDLLQVAIKAAIISGREINKLYNTGDIETRLKEDKSPVTTADLASNKIIIEHLKNTEIPILSEENKTIPYSERKGWSRLWIVDPLDGTKEFLKENGEFTVNIALIKNNAPYMGVIYVPVTKELYFGLAGKGSFKAGIKNDIPDIEKIIESAKKLPFTDRHSPNAVAISRSHMNRATEDFIRSKSGSEDMPALLSRGSSLKICMVAEGSVLYYPRFGPTMEWDIAAGHAIAKHAGKNIYRITDGKEIRYNKEKLLNPDFIVE